MTDDEGIKGSEDNSGTGWLFPESKILGRRADIWG